MPADSEHLTLRHYVDQAIYYHVNEPSLLRLDPDDKLKLDEQDFIVLNSTLTSPKAILEVPTKSHVDSLHEIDRNRRDLLSVYNDQDNEFDKINLIHLDSTTVNTDPCCDNELANKKCVDGSIGQGIVLRFSQTLQNYLKVSVGNDIYNLTKFDKIQITDTTIIKSPNTGGYLLEQWNIKCNDKNNSGRKQNKINKNKLSNILQWINFFTSYR